MSSEGGCLGCGGCLSFIGGIFMVSVAAALLTYALGILATATLVVGILLLVGAGVGLLYNKKPTTLNAQQYHYHQQLQPQPQETYGMSRDPVATIKSWSANDIAQLPPNSRAVVAEIQRTLKGALEDEEFLQFIRSYPIGSRWLAVFEGSELRVRILAVDHDWDGQENSNAQVIITFEHIDSGHRFHWPVQAFADRWAIDPEKDF